jgi:hypothetical protein
VFHGFERLHETGALQIREATLVDNWSHE